MVTVYFCVYDLDKEEFDYSEGRTPDYINGFLKSIKDRTVLRGKREIRDKVVEYEIVGFKVYLVASIKCGLLKHKMDDYSKKSNEGYETTTIKKSNEETTQDNSDGPSLYSQFKSFISSSVSYLTQKTVQVITGKVTLEEAERITKDLLLSRNVTTKHTNLIVTDIMEQFRYKGEDYVTDDKFKEALGESLKKLLKTVDFESILEDEIKQKKGPYSICLVGPNGVGKSTSLAKLTNLLCQKNQSVFIAACDTFRAGAIEQLKIHVHNFKSMGYDVGFYSGGYSKDDSNVAKTAMIQALNDGYDVLLIDTAGRMHNKVDLMRSLSKLVKTNKPDHIVFVGEALTGGDCLDQIELFNNYVKEGRNNRGIDSIILTKTEAVKNKIGNAINLTLESNIPILFFGVGQTYADLKPASPKDITDLLLSKEEE